MRRGVGVTLLLASLATLLLVGAVALKADYWAAPPEEKFAKSWEQDIRLLESSQKLPKEWKAIKEVTVKAANSPAQEWIEHKKAPITTDPKGSHRLEVFVIHWIEGYRYGVVFQYNLVDLTNHNTTWELGRTLKLGFVY